MQVKYRYLAIYLFIFHTLLCFYFYGILYKAGGLIMNKKNKGLMILFLGVSIVILSYAIVSLFTLIDVSKNTVNLLPNDFTLTFTVEEDTIYYLQGSNLSTNSNRSDVDCDFVYSNIDNVHDFECDTGYTIFDDATFQVVIKNTNTNEYIEIESMGNTSVTMNEYSAIGKVSLEEGSYVIEVRNSTLDSDVEFRLQDRAMLGELFKVIFGFMIAFGSFIGFVIFVVINKNGTSMHHSYDYYDQQMNEQDKNNQLYDDDDPFKEFDV